MATPESWDAECARFHAALAAFDAYLASDAELKAPAERLFQGPIADALTHFRGNKARVARELGLSYPTLLGRIRSYGLEREES